MTQREINEAECALATLDWFRQSLQLIACQAINLSEPETIEQARDNLKGLARLILSTCAGKGVEVN